MSPVSLFSVFLSWRDTLVHPAPHAVAHGGCTSRGLSFFCFTQVGLELALLLFRQPSFRLFVKAPKPVFVRKIWGVNGSQSNKRYNSGHCNGHNFRARTLSCHLVFSMMSPVVSERTAVHCAVSWFVAVLMHSADSYYCYVTTSKYVLYCCPKVCTLLAIRLLPSASASVVTHIKRAGFI